MLSVSRSLQHVKAIQHLKYSIIAGYAGIQQQAMTLGGWLFTCHEAVHLLIYSKHAESQIRPAGRSKGNYAMNTCFSTLPAKLICNRNRESSRTSLRQDVKRPVLHGKESWERKQHSSRHIRWESSSRLRVASVNQCTCACPEVKCAMQAKASELAGAHKMWQSSTTASSWA